MSQPHSAPRRSLLLRVIAEIRHSPGLQSITWLAGCAIILTTIAFFIFPWLPWPPVPIPLVVNVDNAQKVSDIQVTVGKVSKTSFQLTVVVTADSPSSSNSAAKVPAPRVSVGLPDGDSVPHGISGKSLPTSDFATVPLADFVPVAGAGLISRTTLDVHGTLFGVGNDGPDTVVALPQVVVSTTDDSTGAGSSANVRVRYPIANLTQLAWLELRPDQTFGGSEEWTYPLTNKATPRATATDIRVSNERQFYGFLAAALFALGGSALIAIIPEIFHERADRRLARSGGAPAGRGTRHRRSAALR